MPVAEEGPSQPPSTAADVKMLLAGAMAAVRAGSLDAKRGTALAFMANALLKAIELSDLETRLTRLEQEHGDETPEAH